MHMQLHHVRTYVRLLSIICVASVMLMHQLFIALVLIWWYMCIELSALFLAVEFKAGLKDSCCEVR